MKKAKLSQFAMQITVATSLVIVPVAGAQAQAVDIFMKAPQVTPEPNAVISAERTRSLNLFKALTGVSIPIDDPRLKTMENYLKSGNVAAAEHVATDDPLFYNFRVAQLAAKMSTRDESARAPLSDMVATFVGVVRDSDSTPATQLLTGNFYYMADNSIITANGGTAVPEDLVKDVLTFKGTHYARIASQDLSLKAVLKRVDGQQIVVNNALQAHPDPAGILTSVAFLAAHATAGTNRRMVEYSFREFMCTPIANWADGTAPDDRVGQDVDRMPGGSPNKYLTTCKNCHTNMDGMRGAFGFLDYNDGSGFPTFSTRVVAKMTRNSDTYPQGFRMTDNSWVTYMNTGKNADQFGWRSAMSGKGIGAFAAMLAKSVSALRRRPRKEWFAAWRINSKPRTTTCAICSKWSLFALNAA